MTISYKRRKALIKRIGWRAYQNLRTRLLIMAGKRGLASAIHRATSR